MSRFARGQISSACALEQEEVKKYYGKDDAQLTAKMWNSFAPKIFALRIVGALVQQASYVPDEYYQSADVIHNFVLNQTGVTWEWEYPIRSSIWFFPVLIISKMFHLLNLYHFVNVQLLLRIYVGVLTAYSEVRMVTLCCRMYSSLSIAECYCYLSMFSWYQFYAGSRALTNTVESALYCLSATQLFQDKMDSSKVTYLVFAGLSIFIRPSGFLLFLSLFCVHLCHTKDKQSLLTKTIQLTIIIFIICVGYDLLWFGKYTVTPFNFLRVNIVDGISSFYGENRFGFYALQGVLMLNGANYFVGLVGLVQNYATQPPIFRAMAVGVAATVVVMEFGAHKEARFAHFSIPFFTLCSAPVFAASVSDKVGKVVASANVFLALYFSLVHQRGAGDVSRLFRTEFCPRENWAYSATFYGPCHVMPGAYSTFCRSGAHFQLRQLECPPPLDGKADESAIFFDAPLEFVNSDLSSKPRPDFIIVFEHFEKTFSKLFERFGYSLYKKVFHCHLPNQNHSRNILIFKKH